jgi:enterochelin esterase family protein
MKRALSLIPVLAGVIFAADTITAPHLIELSKKPGAPAFAEALHTAFKEQDLKDGKAAMGQGPDFLWAIESEKAPVLFVDDARVGPLTRAGATNLWFRKGTLETGTSHTYYYEIASVRTGGSTDLGAYGPDSYEQDVPHGRMSDKLQFTSKIFDGMVSDYWIYVPAQYDAATPAALMVWQDGHNYVDRDSRTHLANVVDNLIAKKKIPVMIQVLIDPGKIGDKAMRSVEYDTVSDRYPRFLRDEILAEVETKYNIRKDGYSRGIGGESSGGICSFNAAWFMPDQFSRALSRIGSFTSIQWHPGEIDGGNVYPFKIRKEPKRNIRVWLQDGYNDLENNFGSWPLQNIQMANSLKMMGYDFFLTFGTGSHNTAQGNAQLPEALTWLWRDYDTAKITQEFTIDPAEKEKPYFRVKIFNR